MVGRGFLKPDLSRLRTDTPKVRKQSLVLMLSILELSGRSTVVRSTISLVDPILLPPLLFWVFANFSEKADISGQNMHLHISVNENKKVQGEYAIKKRGSFSRRNPFKIKMNRNQIKNSYKKNLCHWKSMEVEVNCRKTRIYDSGFEKTAVRLAQLQQRQSTKLQTGTKPTSSDGFF